MLKALEAVVEKNGEIHFTEPVHLKGPCKAIVTIIEEDTVLDSVPETALLSERALGRDWNRPEEDKAWAHLQKGQ